MDPAREMTDLYDIEPVCSFHPRHSWEQKLECQIRYPLSKLPASLENTESLLKQTFRASCKLCTGLGTEHHSRQLKIFHGALVQTLEGDMLYLPQCDKLHGVTAPLSLLHTL